MSRDQEGVPTALANTDASAALRDQLRLTLRGFLREHAPQHDLVRRVDGGTKQIDDLWRALSRELGIGAIGVPEAFGGLGLSYAEVCMAMEELGYALTPTPFFGTIVLAANLLLLSDDDSACRDTLPDLVSGDRTATVTVSAQSFSLLPAVEAARLDGSDAWRLSGSVKHVIDGHRADLLVVPARTAEGVSLFLVDSSDDKVATHLVPSLDLTRHLATVEMSDAPGRPIGAIGSGAQSLARLSHLIIVALAAEQIGGASAVLDMSVEWAKQRVQFGRAIGSFQAIKHRAVDMLLQVDAGAAIARNAALHAATGHARLPESAHMAKAYCSDTFTRAAAGNIQIHGGIGFTWEHPAHLYLRRAKSSELMFGTPAEHRRLLGDLLHL